MLLVRGMQAVFPLMGTWWLVMSLINLALPPFPNFMGELFIITSMVNWSQWTLVFTGVGVLITAGYSLHLYLTTQRGPVSGHAIGLGCSHTREHLLLALHGAPLILLVLKPEKMWG